MLHHPAASVEKALLSILLILPDSLKRESLSYFKMSQQKSVSDVLFEVTLDCFFQMCKLGIEVKHLATEVKSKKDM